MRVVLLCLLLTGSLFAQQAIDSSSPRLLLTTQRLKRMGRDRERQTDRWLNFEKRVLAVPDSPERGFELALYSVLTGDQKQAKAAAQWALAHPCERRQVALVMDWLRTQLSDADRTTLMQSTCPDAPSRFEQARNRLFQQVIEHGHATPADVRLTDVPSGSELYALSEYLDVYNRTQHEDLREQDIAVYRQLPSAFLVSMRPEELEHPSWQQHIAALALVSLDPNMQSSQFLQGWALEDRFVLQDGPGVAYEFFWADAYLPGVGYQNLQPWVYWQDKARFWARRDWSPDSCWVKISAQGVNNENCPVGWQQQNLRFADLLFVPLPDHCATLPALDRSGTIMIHGPPNANLTYTQSDKKSRSSADAAGLWTVSENTKGRICVTPGFH